VTPVRSSPATQGSDCLLGCDPRAGAPQQPPPAALAAALRRCVLAVSPLLRCASLPPRHIGNFAEWSERREAVSAAFCYKSRGGGGGSRGWGRLGGGGGGGAGQAAGVRGRREERPPVEPLSFMAGNEFLHRPFDVSEVRLEAAPAAAPWLAV
jgi:hypothetical protein